jgi:deazaflavin-dependent oxidoreductase (nitroreductase family)
MPTTLPDGYYRDSMSVRRRLQSWGNRFGVWLYRRTSGRAGGGADKVLVLTVPGRRTATPRSTCMSYVETADGLLVWGSASGAPSDPDWFRNLRAVESAQILVGDQVRTVVPRELLGAERDAAWQTVLARRPGVARYARKAGRTIPVALLVS